MTRVAISPDMLEWARERAGMEPESLLPRFAKYEEWETGETQPTLKQLEKFAKAVHVPMGYLFLPEPPQENLPIPDFRTLDNRQLPDQAQTFWTCSIAVRKDRLGTKNLPRLRDKNRSNS